MRRIHESQNGVTARQQINFSPMVVRRVAAYLSHERCAIPRFRLDRHLVSLQALVSS